MNGTRYLDLPDVTICAIDTINPALAARALDTSMSQCRFGDALLLAHEEVTTRARFVRVERLQSLGDYSIFMIKQLARYISTPWVLVVQWDGYVVDGSRWTDTFRRYDYIGARWLNVRPGLEVGNGGFSLRSSKLLEALSDDRFKVGPDAVEDALICGTWRSSLEDDFGISFASGEVADHFSYEYEIPRLPTFGFHGVFNMWRHIEDREMLEIIRDLDIRTLCSPRGVALLKNYCDFRKFACVNAIYQRYRKHWSAQDVIAAFMRNGLHVDTAQQCLRICEAA
ncbi:DUF5672 family protein [Paraburkholderia sp. A2WS-5]|uniref:DUF5672 family protein n=1 Tax=unclassified Paraburkholderia TaxID=2615204 RepID=UPI003B78A5E7